VLRAAVLESYLLEAAGEHERSGEVTPQGMREAEANGLTRALGTFVAINVAELLFALGRWDELSRRRSPPPTVHPRPRRPGTRLPGPGKRSSGPTSWPSR
jgi:hypothetical protein